MKPFIEKIKLFLKPKPIVYCGDTKVFFFFNKRCKKSCPWFDANCYYRCTDN